MSAWDRSLDEILAGQLREMWSAPRTPGRFALVEQGANDGQLALDILSASDEEMLAAIEYWIVEPFPLSSRHCKSRR